MSACQFFYGGVRQLITTWKQQRSCHCREQRPNHRSPHISCQANCEAFYNNVTS